MGEMERQIQQARVAQKRQQRTENLEKAWRRSPFSSYYAVVQPPTGELAAFVQELIPLIPRRLWRTAYVGQSPDGLTRVAMDWLPSEGGFFTRVLAYSQVSRCQAYGVQYDREGDLFVVLKDGRAGYTGSLKTWRLRVPGAVGSGSVAEAYVCHKIRPDWQFA